MVRLDMFACLFYRESPGCIIFFNAAGFKPRWQPWRTFLVRNCVLLFFQKNRCSKVNISFIFLPRMCRYFSWWSRAGKWVETSTQSSHGASKHIWPKYGRLKSSATGLLTKSPAYIMLLAGREVRIVKTVTEVLKIHFQARRHSFSLYGPTLSRLITCLSFSCGKLSLRNFVIELAWPPSTNLTRKRVSNTDTRQRKMC